MFGEYFRVFPSIWHWFEPRASPSAQKITISNFERARTHTFPSENEQASSGSMFDTTLHWAYTFKFNEMHVKIWSQQVLRRGPGPQAPDSHVLTKNCFIERFKAPSSVELKQSSRKCNFGIFDVCVKIPYPNFISYTATNTVLKKFFISISYLWLNLKSGGKNLRKCLKKESLNWNLSWIPVPERSFFKEFLGKTI